MHKSLFLSASQFSHCWNWPKDIAGAVLCPVSLHLSVLCSITQYMLAAAFLHVSHWAAQKKASSTYSGRHKYCHKSWATSWTLTAMADHHPGICLPSISLVHLQRLFCCCLDNHCMNVLRAQYFFKTSIHSCQCCLASSCTYCYMPSWKGGNRPSVSHLQRALGYEKDFCVGCSQPPELPQYTPGQKWGSEENSTKLQTK